MGLCAAFDPALTRAPFSAGVPSCEAVIRVLPPSFAEEAAVREGLKKVRSQLHGTAPFRRLARACQRSPDAFGLLVLLGAIQVDRDLLYVLADRCALQLELLQLGPAQHEGKGEGVGELRERQAAWLRLNPVGNRRAGVQVLGAVASLSALRYWLLD